MAATGYTPSILFNSVTTGNAPSSLVQGETAWNITDKKLWVGNASSTPIQLIGSGADATFTNLAYTDTLTGGTGVVNLGSGQFYKDASGNVGIGTSSPKIELQTKTSGGIQAGSSGELAIRYNMYNSSGDKYIQAINKASSLVLNAQGQLLFYNTDTASTAADSAVVGFTERMRIDSSGNLLVNTSANYSTSSRQFTKFDEQAQVGLTLQSTNATTGGAYIYFVNSAGALAGNINHTTSTTVAYLSTSDKRLKENIVDSPDVLTLLNNVKVRSYDWIEDKTHVNYGFIAQELYPLVPEAVGKGDDSEFISNPNGTWQIDYARLTPLLVKAIQELNAKVTALEAQLSKPAVQLGE